MNTKKKRLFPLCVGGQKPWKLVDITHTEDKRRTVPYQEEEQIFFFFFNFCTVFGILI